MNTRPKTKIILIVGPTASGKTVLSLEIAKKFNGEIISADSRQVYRGLDIGTEKITREEMAGIPHHLIDAADIETIYTASDFKNDAENAIKNITENNKLPIIAGGTFFYIDALLGKVTTPNVPPDHELREQLEKIPAQTLFSALRKLDPKRAVRIDPQNKRRLIRALEIIKSLGQVPAPEQKQSDSYEILCIGIEVDRDVLRTRLRIRAQHALERGLVEETKKILESGISRERLTEIGHEYAVVLDYLDGSFSDAELIQKLEEKNWHYAKRQLTWLKRMEHVHWFRYNDPAIFTTVKTFLHT